MPRDLQHVVSKTYFAEKVAEAQDKASEGRQAVLTNEMKAESEKRANSVAETEDTEGKTIDAKEERRKREEERKKT